MTPRITLVKSYRNKETQRQAMMKHDFWGEKETVKKVFENAYYLNRPEYKLPEPSHHRWRSLQGEAESVNMSLIHVVDRLHELFAEVIGLLHGAGFAIDADNGLGIRLAEVNPAVGEVDLHTVYIIDRCAVVVCEHLLDLREDGIDIGTRGEVNTVFGNLIVRECLVQFADSTAFLCKAREEEGNAYQSVAAVVAIGIDNTTVAFATDDGAHFFHLRGDVDLSDSSGMILTAMLLGNITQGTGRRQVGDCRQSRLIILIIQMTQNIVSDTDQRVFFAEHGTIFADEGQAVYIGVHDDTEVETTFLHLVHDAVEVSL